MDPFLGCMGREEGLEDVVISDTSEESYGVFLGIDRKTFDISLFENYKQVVVDAQELSRDQLARLHENGHVVYSYLNVGSIENTRDYFGDYEDICLDSYDNWPDEYWVDVTQYHSGRHCGQDTRQEDLSLFAEEPG